MIYGDKTAAEYSQTASQLPVGRDGLARLAELGLIEVIPTNNAASSPAPLLTPMADTVLPPATHTRHEAALQKVLYPEFVRAVSDLGLRSVFLVLKVERAMSADDLLALRQEVEAAINKAQGEAARQVFAQRVDFLLAQ